MKNYKKIKPKVDKLQSFNVKCNISENKFSESTLTKK